MMANSNRKLFGHECGMGRNNSGAYYLTGTVNNNLDKAVSQTLSLAGRDIFKWHDGFFEFATAFFEILFVETDGGYFGVGIDYANEAAVVDRVFGAI